jgi:hypothetical protein
VGEGVFQKIVSQRYAEPLVQLGVEPRFVDRIHWVRCRLALDDLATLAPGPY